MTIRKAVLIGTLSAIAVGLIAFGIKTKSFSNKITTPIANKRNALRVDAEDVQPISMKWLLDSNIENNWDNLTNFTQDTDMYYWYTSLSGQTPTYTNTTKIYNYPNRYSQSSIQLYQNNQFITAWKKDTGVNSYWTNNAKRIWTFNTEPTGNIYTLLNLHATPIYNSDVIIYTNNTSNYPTVTWNNNGIQQVRKGGLAISENQLKDGAIINQTGTIQILLDAGCSSLKINGTEYLTENTNIINITNSDIIIYANGTTTGQYWKTFTINYFNTRPDISPIPIPDVGDQVVEVIDIMPMMFKILTMPFTFISQAFNVTLWEGTPYAFNFANFILSLIAIATLLFIIRLFTSGLSIIGNYSANHESRALKRSQTKLNKAKTKEIQSGKPKVTIHHNYEHKDK